MNGSSNEYGTDMLERRGASTRSIGRPQDNFSPRARPIWTAAQAMIADRRAEDRTRFLFLCAHNSARSQMAEGLLRGMAVDRFEVFSAGTESTRHSSETLDRYLGEPL